MPVNTLSSAVKRVLESGEVNVSYVLNSLILRGYRTAVVVSLTQTLYLVLLIISASMTRENQKILTSERGDRIYKTTWKRKLRMGNSGLPTGRNPHGNGAAIVGGGISVRSIHTKVRQPNVSSKPKARVGRGSLEELLTFDEDGKCNNAYRTVCRKDVLMSAYDRIKSKPGNMTPGADRETLDGISEK